MRKKVTLIFLFLMACAFVSDACAEDLAADTSPSAQPLSLPTEYVIAVDQSGSMEGTDAQRNEAIAALVNSLPYDAARCALFYFTYEEKRNGDKTFSEMMDMSVQENRDNLIRKAQGAKGSYREQTNLPEMMRVALSKFSDYDSDQKTLGRSARHIIYAITDGKSGGTSDSAANQRSQASFESLCRKYADAAELYVVYVSGDDAWLKELCAGLGTTPITIDETENGAEFRDRLSRWNPGESAKVLAIENFGYLETALLNLRYADADEIINRTRGENGAVSFHIPPLGVRELSVSLSGGKRVADTLESLSPLQGGSDLLPASAMGDTSNITISSESGLPAGEYSLNVTTDSPVSIVLAMWYGFRTSYRLEGLEDSGVIPVNMPIPLQMELSNPDGSRIDDGVPLAMKVYRLQEDGGWLEILSAPNETPLRLTEESENLRLVPVVNGREQETFWDVRARALPLELAPKTFSVNRFLPGKQSVFLANVGDVLNGPFFPARDVRFSVSGADGVTLTKTVEKGMEALYLELDAKLFAQPYELLVSVTDSAQQTSQAPWRVSVHVGLLDFLFWAAVIAAAVVLVRWKIRKQAEIKERAEREHRETEERKAREAKQYAETMRKQKATQAYQAYLQPHDKLLIRAGLRCKVTLSSGEIMMGALGLTDERGRPRRGCLIQSIPMLRLDEKKQIQSCPNPLPFGLWRHNPEFRCTELILPETAEIHSSDPDRNEPTQIVPCCEETIPALLQQYGIDSASTRLFVHSVSADPEQRACSVCLEAPNLRADFRLEYYTDEPPFYWSEREADI